MRRASSRLISNVSADRIAFIRDHGVRARLTADQRSIPISIDLLAVQALIPNDSEIGEVIKGEPSRPKRKGERLL